MFDPDAGKLWLRDGDGVADDDASARRQVVEVDRQASPAPIGQAEGAEKDKWWRHWKWKF